MFPHPGYLSSPVLMYVLVLSREHAPSAWLKVVPDSLRSAWGDPDVLSKEMGQGCGTLLFLLLVIAQQTKTEERKNSVLDGPISILQIEQQVDISLFSLCAREMCAAAGSWILCSKLRLMHSNESSLPPSARKGRIESRRRSAWDNHSCAEVIDVC